MARTNPFTADAATQTTRAPLRPMRLLGIFHTDASDYILMRTRTGETIRLADNAPVAGLTLVGTGDGWAMINEAGTLHRLVVG